MIEGACMCGKVRYEIEGVPRFMYQCHCGKCRAASGASFVTNLIVDAARFRISAGQDALTAFESSPQKFRHFCSACGSPIYSHGEKTKHVVSVRCGTLKQDPGLRVAYHAFVDSKAAWVGIRDELPQFPEWPDPELVSRLFNRASQVSEHDPRPAVGVAHVVLETDRMDKSAEFMRKIGMRALFDGPEVSVYEMRGGTHLILMSKERVVAASAAFDLMVDDLQATHERLAQLGLAPSPIESRPAIDHQVFTVREPAGHVITFFSSHASGKPV